MKLLDLFCGAGGAAMEYHRAGFEVTGVDIKPQPHFLFKFIQADAMTFPLDGYDVIHASPPCQAYSVMRHLPWLKNREYPKLIEPVREMLIQSKKSYVIENVKGSPLSGFFLCGTMFNLKVYRHRVFESNVFMLIPAHNPHTEVIGRGRMLNDRAAGNPQGWVSLPSKVKLFAGREKTEKGTLNRNYNSDGMVTVGGHNFKKSVASVAMGIDWMNRDELSQAIPPAYTFWIGKQLMRHLLKNREGI